MNAQVGIGTTTPNASAILEVDVSSLTPKKGFLPPRMSTAQRDAISNPAEGLTIYNTDKKCLQFFDGSFWFDACEGIADVPTVIGANGVVWMDRNLGATQVATALDDPDSYGDLYQWGRSADGHELRTSPTYNAVESTDGVANFNDDPANAWDGEFILRNSGANNWVDPAVSGVDDLWQGVNGTNNPCPTGCRLPTETELNEERLSWSSINSAGAFTSPLKLPVAGYRARANGSPLNVGSNGVYWSSTVSGTLARYLFFVSSNADMSSSNRASGYSVRCIKD